MCVRLGVCVYVCVCVCLSVRLSVRQNILLVLKFHSEVTLSVKNYSLGILRIQLNFKAVIIST